MTLMNTELLFVNYHSDKVIIVYIGLYVSISTLIYQNLKCSIPTYTKLVLIGCKIGIFYFKLEPARIHDEESDRLTRFPDRGCTYV